ncbi:MAG: GerMN domain-containing protein [Clostridia bacterium]|nr:GerMN domain-containing protein [Clostridia bacterium]
MLEPRRIIICVVIITIVGSIIGYFVYINNQSNDMNINNTIEEITPEEEISDAQIRQTMISLYFKDDKGIIPEVRYIDVKDLIGNPYYELLELLIKGPKNGNLKKTIPEGTKINKIDKVGEVLVIDFSKEFIENHVGGEEEEKITINSIVNTLTELTEINGIKIKVDGEENKSFKDELVGFDNTFYRDNTI